MNTFERCISECGRSEARVSRAGFNVASMLTSTGYTTGHDGDRQWLADSDLTGGIPYYMATNYYLELHDTKGRAMVF